MAIFMRSERFPVHHGVRGGLARNSTRGKRLARARCLYPRAETSVWTTSEFFSSFVNITFIGSGSILTSFILRVKQNFSFTVQTV